MQSAEWQQRPVRPRPETSDDFCNTQHAATRNTNTNNIPARGGPTPPQEGGGNPDPQGCRMERPRRATADVVAGKRKAKSRKGGKEKRGAGLEGKRRKKEEGEKKKRERGGKGKERKRRRPGEEKEEEEEEEGGRKEVEKRRREAEEKGD